MYDVQLTKTGNMTDFGECQEPSPDPRSSSCLLPLPLSLPFIYCNRMAWYISILGKMQDIYRK